MLRRIHKWLGVALTAWLLTATITGSLLLWQDEYYGWRYPSLPERDHTVPANADIIERIVSDAGQAIDAIRTPTKTFPAYLVFLADGSEAIFHPETSVRVAEWGKLDSLPAFLFELHAHLLLGSTGQTVVGVFAIALLLTLIIGLVLWSRRTKVYRARYFMPKNLTRPMLARAHAAQGLVFFVLFLFIALTGIAVALSAPVYAGLNAIFGAEPVLRPRAALHADLPAANIDWQAVLESVRREFPNGTPRELSVPDSKRGPLIVRLRNAGELHPNGRSYLVLHAETGAVLERIDATRTGVGPTIGNALYPIHSGKTGWPGHRLVLVILAMSLFFIAFSGSYLALTGNLY